MDDLAHRLAGLWPWVAATLSTGLAVVVGAHIVLRKRDVRAAIGWVGLVLLVPVLGSALYGLLGINRIRRRAKDLRRPRGFDTDFTREVALQRQAAAVLPAGVPPRLAALASVVGTSTGLPLVPGNRIEPLLDGDAAFPAMVAAIDAAERSVGLATYIFDDDRAGRLLADALARAVARGVAVRVLVDDVGARYSRPVILRRLRRLGVPAARFLPARFPLANPFFNLRNHRKLLVVDGRVGFTGGMNIREGCLLQTSPRHPVRDLHFRVDGPVVRHLADTFAFDWHFTTRETLAGDAWVAEAPPAGPVVARGIPDGPDEDFETLHDTLLGALATAEHSVRILTPYFLPDEPLIDALRIAAMRGVRVEVLLPGRGNLPVVEWAATAQLWQLLRWGVRVWRSPAPFDHGKLLVVDGAWSLLGSANWDPRSLRLNFEFGLECYDAELAARLGAIFEERRAAAVPWTMRDSAARPLPAKLRDGVARLLSPYL